MMYGTSRQCKQGDLYFRDPDLFVQEVNQVTEQRLVVLEVDAVVAFDPDLKQIHRACLHL